MLESWFSHFHRFSDFDGFNHFDTMKVCDKGRASLSICCTMHTHLAVKIQDVAMMDKLLKHNRKQILSKRISYLMTL